jgi:hypothetical protein
MLVLSGLPALLENLSRSKSYTERMFVVEELGNLRPPEDQKAFADPAKHLGRQYDRQVVEAVLDETAGYPYFLQLYGDALWKGSRGPIIAGDDFQRLRPEIMAGLDHSSFEARYLRTSPGERALLHAVARSGESATVDELQQATGKGNNALQPLIARLIQKGILYRPARGRVAFTTPLFGAFLRRRGL